MKSQGAKSDISMCLFWSRQALKLPTVTNKWQIFNQPVTIVLPPPSDTVGQSGSGRRTIKEKFLMRHMIIKFSDHEKEFSQPKDK